MTVEIAHRSLRHVAVIRALPGVGDLLCMVPALRSIRRGSPAARVTLVGLPSSAWFVERFRWYVDDLLVLPHWPSIPEATGRPSATVGMLASALPPFDLAVQLHGSGGPINRLGPALGAGYTVAHELVEVRAPRFAARAWPSTGHESERLLDLVTWAGFPDSGAHLEFPELDGDAARIESFVDGLPGPVLVVHPGASRPDRRWDAAGFAAIVDLAARAGLVPVLTGGPCERELMRQVASRAAGSSPRVAPPLSLGELGALLRRSAGLVVNDTGVAHLGVAVGTPTVVVGTTSDLDRWGPTDRVRHRAVRTTGLLHADVAAVWDAVVDVAAPGGDAPGARWRAGWAGRCGGRCGGGCGQTAVGTGSAMQITS